MLTPHYEIIRETDCSLEQVRDAIGKNLYNPGVFIAHNGAAVGVIEGNEFRLQFKKSTKNGLRPEFKGSFFEANHHVTISIRCGLTAGMEVIANLYLGVIVLIFASTLIGLIAGHGHVDRFFFICIYALFNFVFVWRTFLNEYQSDKIRMMAILDSIGREEVEA